VIDYFLQTLTTLGLLYNEIGQQGAEHFANVLKENKVKWQTLISFSSNCSITILTDTHHT
jgi:hypothetical protein